ncbi:wd and tetratricopeptide repeat protein [Pseudozyma hubeiensis SY62]|uniref:Wd and tetratricopeptide repeat protein n=1 Tax=Pseudozyma hubeiensis (strain SY62) TaxID=1305764 RepID=R9P8F5_PSEHS|nr:wd and tetratricopeptide repeat protein [Pseudozyma hubeiensis SY62]GAC97629.1 wd and tetratricopeptide repeat protein [Pseudozyma hubeiensis SY62]
MALHQFFTLAFALHLEPLPTLDYATVPYVQDTEHSTGSLQETDKLRVGANTKLDPIHTRHLPHNVDTLSFLLNHTRAIEAVQPFSKLISLLEEADDDPEFRNLRDFFDSRYDPNGSLIGADKDKDPHRRIRSLSRAASTKQPDRRSSHATQTRKSSFAASLGGTSALKLNWLKRNTHTDSHTHDASDDDDTHSRVSSGGHSSSPAPPSAPYIRLSRHPQSYSPSGTPASSSQHRHSDHDSSTTVTFPIRLDLHTVGLAPPPPKLRSNRQPESSGAALQRIGSGRSANSSDWRRRRASKSSLTSGGAALGRIASPDSMASFGAVSAIANGDSDFQHAAHSGFSIDTSALSEPSAMHKSKLTPSSENPAHAANADSQLSSISEGTVPTSDQLTSPTSAKPTRRPSMMSKLLDFGRKKSFLDRLTSDSHDARSASPAPSHRDDLSDSQAAPNASGSRTEFRSALNRHPDHATFGNDEALELDEEDDEGVLHAQMMRQATDRNSAEARRASSGGSSGKRHKLGPVQEDGLLDLTMVSSRSSVGTSYSEHNVPRESLAGNASAADASASKRQPPTALDGADFLSLFRAASCLGLSSIQDSIDDVGEDSAHVTTPSQESKDPHVTDTGSTNTPSTRTPQIRPKISSLPTTPGRSIRSIDLERSPNPHTANSNPIDASFKLGASLAQKNAEEQEAWWPCGEVDPLPITLASALGEALGWEGIMHLCYGRGSRAEAEGNYAALGKAAALDQANKMQERTVQAWRTGVASAGTSPPKKNENLPSLLEMGGPDTASLAGELAQKLNLDPADPLHVPSNASALEHLHGKAPQRSSTVPPTAGTEDAIPSNGAADAGAGWTPGSLLFGSRLNHSRTWQHWQALFKSIKGWVDEYEKARVRGGLAREIGLDPNILQGASNQGPDESEGNITISAPLHIDSTSPDTQVPLTVGSPPSASTEVLKVARDKVDVTMLSKVLGTSLSISPCVLADATNRAHGFRRRAGIPEGLPLGPENEETIDYTWSRKRLSVEHFATALTISCDSALHYFGQLSTSKWLYRSAWELDYLEMCVFKSPLVADRFPPPGEAVVPVSQSYRPAPGAQDRSRTCPNPDEAGAWDADNWKRWLASIREGDIIVPAIAWQAWWTLISVLNGADRTGRSYDLQVKSLEEPFDALNDLSAVYL